MRFLSILFAIAGIIVTALAASVDVDEYNDRQYPHRNNVPDHLRLRSITYDGNGCPDGSVTLLPTDDQTTFSLMFDKFKAKIGGGIPQSLAARQCNVNINFRSNAGWKYAVSSTEYSGHLRLDRQVSAKLKSTQKITGQVDQWKFSEEWRGPFDEDYRLNDAPAASAFIWSHCGRADSIKIETKINLARTNPRRSGAHVSPDGFIQTYHIQWRRCRP